MRRERSAYAAKKALGIYEGDKYLSMIIDAADQSDHALPHSATKSHTSDAAWKIKLHLIGVLVHGRGSYVYTCPPHLAQGNNITVQALWDTIVKIKTKNGKLPPVLFLQLDNTTKSCKGRYLMAFLALLVEHNVFKKIVLSFLPVGHTHEDIDQFFSCISRTLRFYDAHSRLSLAHCIKRSFRKWGVPPEVTHWTTVANISGWMEDGNKVVKHKDIMAYAAFRFFRSAETGTVWEQARRWPGGGHDDHWGGLTGNDVRQQVWKDDKVPNLLDEYDNVPGAARTKGGPPSAQVQEQVRAGLDSCYVYMKVAEDDKDDCDKLYDLYTTPLSDPMPFAWSKQVVNSILSSSCVCV